VEEIAMEKERYDRNVDINALLETWEWCSRRLHVKWQRKRKLRNGCFIGMAVALSEESPVSPFQLLNEYRTLPSPLLNRVSIGTFWDVQPVALLELCLGSYTKGSPLTKPLNQLRSIYQGNPTLDELAQKMRCREKHFGSEWFSEGHHPDREFRLLKKEMRPLCRQLRVLLVKEHRAVEKLAQEVLAKGWQFGEIPALWRVRRTPETLLNKSIRLKLWQVAQEVLFRDLDEEARLEALCQVLYQKITPSIKSAIESQGYSVDNIVDDMVNFDVHKSRAEITA
jgi:hypothetical protein